MKRFFSAILIIAILAACSSISLADHGEAEIVFGGKTYHFILESIELTDDSLKVAVRGKESVPMAGFSPQTPAMCMAKIGGESLTARTIRVEINDGLPTYIYTFDKAERPESILIFPNGSDSGRRTLWEEGDAIQVKKTETKAEQKTEPKTETIETEVIANPDIPAGIVGEWFGTAIPNENNHTANSSELELDMVIRADGNGECMIIHDGKTERYPLTIEMDGDNIFYDLTVPEDNGMGAKSLHGRIRIKNGWLKVTLSAILKDSHVDGYEAKCTSEPGAIPEEDSIPERLIGKWHGSAKNEYDEKDMIDLTLTVHEDGSGVAEMIRNDVCGTFDLTVNPEDEMILGVFTEDNAFGMDDFTGEYKLLPEGKIKLDIYAFTKDNRLLVYYMECDMAE